MAGTDGPDGQRPDGQGPDGQWLDMRWPEGRRPEGHDTGESGAPGLSADEHHAPRWPPGAQAGPPAWPAPPGWSGPAPSSGRAWAGETSSPSGRTGWAAPGPVQFGPQPHPGPGAPGPSGPPGGWPGAYEPGSAPPPWAVRSSGARGHNVVLRPLSLGEILDGSVKSLRANIKSFYLWLLLAAAPCVALLQYSSRDSASLLGALFRGNTSQVLHDRPSAADEVLEYGAFIALLVVFGFMASLVCRAAARHYCAPYATAGRVAPRPPRRSRAATGFALVVASLTVHLVELGSVVFLVLPALAFMAFFAMTTPCVVVEGLGPWAAMRRSWSLVAPQFWRVLGISILGSLMAALATDLVITVPELLVDFVIPGPAPVVNGALAALGIALQWSFVGTMTTLLYLDLRIRQEGLDVEAMTAALG